MKAYVEPPPIQSRCLRRIADALTQYAPDGVEIVQDRATAELVVLHVIGRQRRMSREAKAALAHGQAYAILQLCLRSTQQPSTEGWRALWDGAAVVWSYYDLPVAIAADGGCGPPGRFYHAPLGVDTEVFHPGDGPRPYLVGMTGCDWHYLWPEALREVAAAAEKAGGAVWHLGPPMGLGSHVTSEHDLEDVTLAERYRACRYVSGLRRKEGFELPAAEGLLCGARPIVFDTPAWREWYEPWAVFVPESCRPAVLTEALVQMFAREPEPVTAVEWAAAAERFSWRRIVRGFWETCLS